ncbi:glycoside hydrolase family 3 N-terminal domain-containing protein [Thalassotalea ganghwensis]
MKSKFLKAAIVVSPMLLLGCSPEIIKLGRDNTNTVVEDNIWPKITSEVETDPKIEARIIEIMSSMTLEQKIAQMIQPEIRDITVDDMRRYGFGSYLNGGGAFPNNNKHSTPEDWITLAENMYQASIDDSLDGSTIPTMWGTDAVHGHNNVIGATLFPHNIGLGAANNPALIEKIAQVTATEVMVTGIDWVFAPTVATVRDDRWGRTYEGYSEDPEIVKSYAKAIVHGLQGHANKDFLADNRVISTVKHFVGDGGTLNGVDQGNNLADEQTLFDIHAQGYVGGLTAGAQSVMASFNSWQGDKIHGNRYLLTNVLKETMGFDGFVVGDWNGHGQVKGCTNSSCPAAINAGLDIFMAPTETWKPLMENTIEQVKQGIIPLSRIDDAVSRILRVKLRAGLFEKPSPEKRRFSGKTELIGSSEHRAVARQAVRESLVLLKNNNNLLPLSPNAKVLIAGDGANNIGKQSGGWTITWQGTNNTNNDFPGGTSIYDGLKQQILAAGGQVELSEDGQSSMEADVAIVIFGEEPYAEGQGDIKDLVYQAKTKSDLALLKRLKSRGIPVVSVFISGRPMWVNAELNASDAFVAAWLPGSEGLAVADVLLKNPQEQIQHDFKGKLSFSWPKSPDQIVNRHDEDYQPLFAYGYGLTYRDSVNLSNDLNEHYDIDHSSKSLAFFDGGIVSPWQLALQSKEEKVVVSSNSVEINGVSFRTIDRNVQEDAFHLTFDGSEYASVEFLTQQTLSPALDNDLKTLLTQPSLFNFTINIENEVTQPVLLSFGCENTVSCLKSVDIKPLLNQLESNKWHSFTVDSRCLIDAIVTDKELKTALKLSTTGTLNLSVNRMVIEEKPEHQKADLECQ